MIRNAEINQLQFALDHQEVCRLQISVDDTLCCYDVVEGAGQCVGHDKDHAMQMRVHNGMPKG